MLVLSENRTVHVFWLRKTEKDVVLLQAGELLKCHYFVCNKAICAYYV
jgi:hypothetical protein